MEKATQTRNRRGLRIDGYFILIFFIAIAAMPLSIALSIGKVRKETETKKEILIPTSKVPIADSINNDWVNDSGISIERRRIYDHLIKQK